MKKIYELPVTEIVEMDSEELLNISGNMGGSANEPASGRLFEYDFDDYVIDEEY